MSILCKLGLHRWVSAQFTHPESDVWQRGRECIRPQCDRKEVSIMIGSFPGDWIWVELNEWKNTYRTTM